jgi:Holliday junction DNA helicase RuvA
VIGHLSGKIRSVDERGLVVDVSGVGYVIHPSLHVLSAGVQVGNQIDAFIHTYVRQDQITLYGFVSSQELELFTLLLQVSGLGPKSALSIIGNGSVEEIKQSISKADVEFFRQIKGIGKKTAQRIIVDLRGKVGELGELNLSEIDAKSQQDVMAALRSMGISSQEARDSVKKIDPSLPLEERLREALRQL